MRNIGLAVLLMIGLGGLASATTYYVSSSQGNDANSGTSALTAWQTLAHMNAQTFLPGDSILLRRGDVWNESLVPPSSGASGNPITFDAYGTGAPPNLTGYHAIAPTTWVLVTGNAWKTPIPSTFTGISFCLFGTIWGLKVSASTTNLTAKWDFYIAAGSLYVYSAGNPNTFYAGVPIVPMALTNVPVINVNNQSWLTFQHLLVNWYDDFGVYVQGASDHLIFANMEADSMIPEGTQPLGFYVNESAQPVDIKFYNDSSHMNYDGFRFDGFVFNGTGTPITMVNDEAYANRDGALVDNTGRVDTTCTSTGCTDGGVTMGFGAVTYSYCHFYGSSLAVANSTDVEWPLYSLGPQAGTGNVAVDTPPVVQVWQRYPAEVTLTVDDIGMTTGADTYYQSTVLPIAVAAGVKVGVAVTVGYTARISPIISEIQGWINSGVDVTSHSISHTYYPNTDALDIQYTGSGTAATLSISGKVLTITVTGASDTVSYNVAQGQPQGTILGLKTALTATGNFTATENPVCASLYGTGCSFNTQEALLAQDLADVSGVNVKSAVYPMLLDVTRLTTDEITLSRAWMTANLTGLPTTPVYVYPGGFETPAMQAIAASVPYNGARGALKEDLGVKDTYASGFDIQNVTSFGVNPSWQGLAPSVLNQKVQALTWKEMVWGVPWGIFWHNAELSATEITNLIADLQSAGATFQTNTSLVNLLAGGTSFAGTDGNFYYKSPALVGISANGGVDFRAALGAPVIDAGLNLGTAYEIDINGLNQNGYGSGWEIGAHAFIPYSTYGLGTRSTSYSAVGETFTTAELPQSWVNESEINPPGGTYDVTRTATTFANLQQAICDWAAAPDQWWLVQVPHGTVIDTVGTAYTCTQPGSTPVNALTVLTKIVGGAQPTKFIVFDSDTPLLAGQTVCSHGITDGAGTRQPPSGDISTWWSSGNNGCSNDIGSMWTLEGNWNSGNFGMVIQAGTWDTTTNLGPSHYAFKNLEIRPNAANTASVYPVNTYVNPGGASPPTLVSQMASHIHFANIYGHGDATDWNGVSGGPRNNRIATFMKLDGCQFCSVTDSYFDYVTSTGAESHVLAAVKMPGPLKITHNWLSGGSQVLLTGGTSIPDPLYFVNDLEVRENRMTNPPSWVGVNYGGAAVVLKSRMEFKACQRCLVDGNIAEYSDTSGGQDGQCFTFTPRNCSAGSTCDNYQALLQDVTLTNNICRHAVTGIETAARSTYPGGNGGGATQPLRRVNASNNLFYDLGNQPVYDHTGVVNSPYVIRPVAGGEAYICTGTTVSGVNKVLTCAGGPAGLNATGISAGDMFSVTNCADSTWNIPSGSFNTSRGAIAQVGTNPNGLSVYYSNPAATSSSTTGCIVGNAMGGAPNFNFVHNTIVMQTTNAAKDNGRIYAGSNIQIFTDTGCSGAGSSNSTTITALSRDVTGTIVTATVASTSGWPVNLTSGAQILEEVAGSGDFNGTFYYLGQSGGNLQWMQAGTPSETGGTGGAAAQMGTCPSEIFEQNNIWKNNLVAVDVGTAPSCPGTPSTGWMGWATSGGGNVEGCASGASNASCSENIVDVTDSVVTNTDFPGRCAAKYMEVGGANANAIPPVTLTFPASTVCAGGTADATCVGMKGMMNGGAFDATDSDYHPYGLAASSVYKAGGAGAADDGTDLGVNLTALDAAQTATSYTCVSSCGSGPYGDNTTADVFVSPTGNDSNPGTASQPFLTIGKAQTTVQGLSRTRTTPIRVLMYGGTYSLCIALPCSQLVFNNTNDSGSSAVPIVWEAYPGQMPVVDGGYHLTGWTNAGSACGGACTKYTVKPTGIIYSEQFWYNGSRRMRPRAGAGVLGSYYRLAAGTVTTSTPYTAGDPSDASAAWGNLHSSWNGTACVAISGNSYPEGDVQIGVFENAGMSKIDVQCVDTTSRVMHTLAGTALPATGGNRYFVENIKPADPTAIPQTWFMDRSTSPYTIIYYAAAGENPNVDLPGVVIPQLPASAPQVLLAQGLNWVTFFGITFQHDNWVTPAGGYTYGRLDDNPSFATSTVSSAFSCQGCQHVTLDGVKITQTAGAGADFVSCVVADQLCNANSSAYVSANNTVQNSYFYDLGAHGIRVGMLQHNGDTDANIAQFMTVQNTVVQGIGRNLPKSFGIAMGCGHDNLFTHNDVSDSYGGGINMGALNCPPGASSSNGSFNNVASYNHVWNLAQGLTNDLGCVYINVGTATFEPTGNQILYNRCHDVSDASTQDASGFAGQGIYIDNFTGGVTVTGNLVYRVSAVPMNFTTGPLIASFANVISNNVFAFGRTGSLNLNAPWTSAICPGCTVLKATLSNNIFYWDRTSSSSPAAYVERGCSYSGVNGTPGHGGDSYNLYLASSNNLYFNTTENFASDANAFHFQTTAGAAGGSTPYCSNSSSNWTFVNAAAWQGSPYNEEAGSSFNTDPGFLSPSCAAAGGTDNWNFSAAAPSGFTALPISLMGRLSGWVPGTVMATLPTVGYSCVTDF